jgi:hypothetical protein
MKRDGYSAIYTTTGETTSRGSYVPGTAGKTLAAEDSEDLDDEECFILAVER